MVVDEFTLGALLGPDTECAVGLLGELPGGFLQEGRVGGRRRLGQRRFANKPPAQDATAASQAQRNCVAPAG